MFLRLIQLACLSLLAALLLPFVLPRMLAGTEWFDDNASLWRVASAVSLVAAAVYLFYVSAWSLATRRPVFASAEEDALERCPAEWHR